MDAKQARDSLGTIYWRDLDAYANGDMDASKVGAPSAATPLQVPAVRLGRLHGAAGRSQWATGRPGRAAVQAAGLPSD
jgi:hypothetical protein